MATQRKIGESQIEATINRALAAYRGDDYRRARAAFANLSADEMQKEYGQSGKTRQEILDGYEAHVRAVAAAQQWLAEQFRC